MFSGYTSGGCTPSVVSGYVRPPATEASAVLMLASSAIAIPRQQLRQPLPAAFDHRLRCPSLRIVEGGPQEWLGRRVFRRGQLLFGGEPVTVGQLDDLVGLPVTEL